MSSATEAMVLHCGHYLHSSFMTVKHILHPQLAETGSGRKHSNDMFIPKVLRSSAPTAAKGKSFQQQQYDMKQRELTEAMKRTEIRGTPILDIFADMFDLFMSSLLADLLEYINESDARKIAAHDYKVEKVSLDNLSTKMLAKAKAMVSERLKGQAETAKTEYTEAARQMQSRIASLKMEVALLKKENLLLSGGASSGSLDGSSGTSSDIGTPTGKLPSLVEVPHRFIVVADCPTLCNEQTVSDSSSTADTSTATTPTSSRGGVKFSTQTAERLQDRVVFSDGTEDMTAQSTRQYHNIFQQQVQILWKEGQGRQSRSATDTVGKLVSSPTDLLDPSSIPNYTFDGALCSFLFSDPGRAYAFIDRCNKAFVGACGTPGGHGAGGSTARSRTGPSSLPVQSVRYALFESNSPILVQKESHRPCGHALSSALRLLALGVEAKADPYSVCTTVTPSQGSQGTFMEPQMLALRTVLGASAQHFYTTWIVDFNQHSDLGGSKKLSSSTGSLSFPSSARKSAFQQGSLPQPVDAQAHYYRQLSRHIALAELGVKPTGTKATTSGAATAACTSGAYATAVSLPTEGVATLIRIPFLEEAAKQCAVDAGNHAGAVWTIVRKCAAQHNGIEVSVPIMNRYFAFGSTTQPSSPRIASQPPMYAKSGATFSMSSSDAARGLFVFPTAGDALEATLEATREVEETEEWSSNCRSGGVGGAVGGPIRLLSSMISGPLKYAQSASQDSAGTVDTTAMQHCDLCLDPPLVTVCTGLLAKGSPGDVVAQQKIVFDGECENPGLMLQLSKTNLAEALAGGPSEPCPEVEGYRQQSALAMEEPVILRRKADIEDLLPKEGVVVGKARSAALRRLSVPAGGGYKVRQPSALGIHGPSLEGHVHIAAFTIDGFGWLLEADEQTATDALVVFERQALKPCLEAFRGVLLGFDSTDGTGVCGFSNSIASLEFLIALHEALLRVEWSADLLQYHPFAVAANPKEGSSVASKAMSKKTNEEQRDGQSKSKTRGETVGRHTVVYSGLRIRSAVHCGDEGIDVVATALRLCGGLDEGHCPHCMEALLQHNLGSILLTRAAFQLCYGSQFRSLFNSMTFPSPSPPPSRTNSSTSSKECESFYLGPLAKMYPPGLEARELLAIPAYELVDNELVRKQRRSLVLSDALGVVVGQGTGNGMNKFSSATLVQERAENVTVESLDSSQTSLISAPKSVTSHSASVAADPIEKPNEEKTASGGFYVFNGTEASSVLARLRLRRWADGSLLKGLLPIELPSLGEKDGEVGGGGGVQSGQSSPTTGAVKRRARIVPGRRKFVVLGVRETSEEPLVASQEGTPSASSAVAQQEQQSTTPDQAKQPTQLVPLPPLPLTFARFAALRATFQLIVSEGLEDDWLRGAVGDSLVEDLTVNESAKLWMYRISPLQLRDVHLRVALELSPFMPPRLGPQLPGADPRDPLIHLHGASPLKLKAKLGQSSAPASHRPSVTRLDGSYHTSLGASSSSVEGGRTTELAAPIRRKTEETPMYGFSDVLALYFDEASLQKDVLAQLEADCENEHSLEVARLLKIAALTPAQQQQLLSAGGGGGLSFPFGGKDNDEHQKKRSTGTKKGKEQEKQGRGEAGRGSIRGTQSPLLSGELKEAWDDLLHFATETLLHSEHDTRNQIKELALERYRLFHTMWKATLDAEFTRSRELTWTKERNALNSKVKDLQQEVVQLKNQTLEVSKLRDQLKLTRHDAATTEATVNRTLAKLHYAQHATDALISQYADDGLKQAKASARQQQQEAHGISTPRSSCSNDTTSAFGAGSSSVASGGGGGGGGFLTYEQLLEEWELLFDGLLMDSVNPYVNVSHVVPKTVTAESKSEILKKFELISASVIRMPLDAKGSTTEQLMHSTLCVSVQSAETVQRLLRRLAALESEKVELKEAQAELTKALAAVDESSGKSNGVPRRRSSSSSSVPRGDGRRASLATSTPSPARDRVRSSTTREDIAGRSRSPTTSPLVISISPRGSESHHQRAVPPEALKHTGARTAEGPVSSPTSGRQGGGQQENPIATEEGIDGAPVDLGATVVGLDTLGDTTLGGFSTIGGLESDEIVHPAGKCHCCHQAPSTLVCPGCWGASLCGGCANALHSVIPAVLLRRAPHVLERDFQPREFRAGGYFSGADAQDLSAFAATLVELREDRGGAFLFQETGAPEGSAFITRDANNHILLSQRPPILLGASDQSRPVGVWRPKDVGKALVISQCHRATSPVKSSPIEVPESIDGESVADSLPGPSTHPATLRRTSPPKSQNRAATPSFDSSGAASFLSRSRPKSASGWRSTPSPTPMTPAPVPQPITLMRDKRPKRR